ncbi:MAG: DUF1761 domain-containing protein [Nannocystaceae bacterium]|nr:DUF1761 domain-containing protein [Myxococcales bacterium]
MELNLAALNWVGVALAVVAGQVVSTIWFVVLFGEPWAREYGAASKREHTKQVPGYTYAVGLVCTTLLVLSLAVLQRALSIHTIADALWLAVFVSVGFCVATCVPGQAFLRRWRVALLACGSQVAMILVISLLLVLLP